MRSLQGRLRTATIIGALAAACALPVAQAAQEPFWQLPDDGSRESYLPVPMPPGIQVVHTELEGPVFATAEGRTLYQWPLSGLRNGSLGDRRGSGEATCDDTLFDVTTGYMSPYPPGFELPDLAERRSCEQLWPPLLAEEDARPVGQWSIVKRTNGQQQWAYQGYPVYTSDRDRQAGDVLGGSNAMAGGAMGAVRYPIGPPSDVPPELAVVPLRTGRLLTNHLGMAVYSSDADSATRSNCTADCLKDWSPVLAPLTARERGDWSIIERSSGIRQWVYRGKPLYTYSHDGGRYGMSGADVAGWHNVYTQRALPPPEQFTVQGSSLGQVLADENGRTLYVYFCNDDAADQQACDHPDATQAYRLAVCGNFDAQRCLETFPYVRVPSGAAAASRLWTVMSIDPLTGRRAQPGQAGAIDVWAYRDRPVYTFARDVEPGDTNADAWGEFNGYRNGFKAFWLRDDFRSNAVGRTR